MELGGAVHLSCCYNAVLLGADIDVPTSSHCVELLSLS